MERLKSITIIFLLAVGLLTSAASAKPASVLLQEGLYAEEIEGDLDAAIKIYEQVIAEAKETQRAAAQATYRIGMCFLKKGEKDSAAEYFQKVVSNYRTQKILVKKADEQLKKVKPETKKSVFEEIDYQVIRFLGEQFGKTALEAGQQHLSVNSHIYYVDRDGFRYQGGMNAFFNWTGRTITQKVHFGGTSYQNQTHYGVDGHELNTEIVPDKTRPNHWQIYWIPDEPLAPEEHLYYGWSMNDERKLPKLPGDMYSLIMQNKFGSPVIETFFLVLPKDLRISQSNPSTGSQELLDFNVYWWTKQIQQGENHIEHVQLEKAEIEYIFGPIMGKVINDDGVGEDFMFDLDIGKSFSVSDAKKWGDAPDISEKKSLEDFVMKSGIDLFGETSKKSLMGIDMIAMPIHNERWDMSPEDVIEQVSMCKPGTPVALSADGQLPKTFVFKTGQGGMGILQIIEMQAGKAPRHFKIRYKMLQKESAGRIVFLPDADDVIQQGKVAVVLDLTTGKMLPGNKDKQYFNKLNKGDVAYFDDEGKDLLVCFRGAKITRKTANGKYSDTPDQSHTDNTTHIYIIKKTPAEWTITTKEGDIYELKVLSLDNNQAKIKYRKMPALEKKTSIDEKLRSAFIACGTLCDSIRNALDDDDFETAEALCKEVEKHLAKGLELTPQSELGPMLESLAVQFKIWHEAIKAKDKEKAIRLGEALNHAGGLMSDFVLEEKPDTHK